MSANAGSIVATIGAQADGFTRGIADAATSVEHFSKHMKKLSNDFALVGGLVQATALAMVKSAASINVNADVAMKRFERSTTTLAVQMSTILIPVVDRMGKAMKELADWFAGLSPHTKQNIAEFVLLAGKVAIVALAFGRVMEVVHGVAGVFSVLFSIIAAIGFGPLAAIVLGVALIAGGVVVLRKAWNENWGGMQETVHSVVQAIADAWSKLSGFMADLWAGWVDDFASKIKLMIALWYTFQTATGQMNTQQAGLQQGTMNMAIDATAGAAKSPMAIKALMLEAAQAVKQGAGDVIKDLVDMAKKAKAGVLDYLGLNSSGGHAGGGRDKLGEVTPYSAAVQKAIDSALDTQGGRVGRTATTRGTATAPTPMSLEELQADMTKRFLDAWDEGDWAGMTKSIGERIVLDFTNAESILSGLKVAATAITSKLGKVGEVINAGVQGFQQGGPWGALAAVVMEFVSNFKGWSQIMDISNGQMQMALNDMSKGLSDLVAGLRPLMGAVESIAKAFHQILAPVFSLLGTVLKGIAPVLTVIGSLFQVLAGTLGPAMQIIGGILEPLFKLLALTLSPLVILFMYLKVAVDGVALGFNKFIEWIDEIFQSHANQGGVDAAQAQFDADKQMADSFAQDFLNHPFDALNNLNNNSADAAAAIGAMGNAANSASEQLLNVPSAYKVALTRFNSTQGVSSTQNNNFDALNNQTAAQRRQQFLNTSNPVSPVGVPRKK